MEFSHTSHKKLLKIAEILIERGESLSVAESCTGGLIGAACTELSGSSQWFNGGAIVYQNELKIKLLQVSQETIATDGVVSAQCVSQMLSGALSSFNSAWSIAVSGIAGPTGGTLDKPVGLVYIGVKGPSYEVVTKNIFVGDRSNIRKQAVEKSISLLSEALFSKNR